MSIDGQINITFQVAITIEFGSGMDLKKKPIYYCFNRLITLN
jgi:hypothetical protein